MYVSLVKRNDQVILRLYKDDGKRYFDPIYSWFKILHSKYSMDKGMILKQLRELKQGSPNDVSLLIRFFVGDHDETETDPASITDVRRSPYLYSVCNQMMNRHGDDYLLTLNLNLNSIRGIKVNLINGEIPMKKDYNNAVARYEETLDDVENKIKDIAVAAMNDVTGNVDHYVEQFTQCIEHLFRELRGVAKTSSNPDEFKIGTKMIVNDLIMGVSLSVPVINNANNWNCMLLNETSPELFIESYCNFGKPPEIESGNPISKIKELEIPPMPSEMPRNYPEETQPINELEPSVVVAAFTYNGTMINIQSSDPVKLAEVTKYLLG